jgi:hypothetical protein
LSKPISSNPAEPAKECSTICAPLILVAQDDADPEAVSFLLETIYLHFPRFSCIGWSVFSRVFGPFPNPEGD